MRFSVIAQLIALGAVSFAPSVAGFVGSPAAQAKRSINLNSVGQLDLSALNLLNFFNGYNWQILNLNDLSNLNDFVFGGLQLNGLNGLNNLDLNGLNLNDVNSGIVGLIQEIQGLGNSNDILLQSLEQQLVESMIIAQELQGNNVLNLGNLGNLGNLVPVGKE